MIIYITLLLFVVICLIIFSIDIYFYLLNRYCRFHIGRWNDDVEWIKAIENTSIKWLKRTPTVKLTDNNKLIAIDMISGKYRNKTIQSWQIGGILLGLSESQYKDYQKEIENLLESLINDDGDWKVKPTSVDACLLAYSILKIHNNPNKIKPAMDYCVSIIEKNICSDGMIAYNQNLYERYVDTLGFVCPFLQLYSKIYNKPELSKLCIKQIDTYNKYGLLYNTYLPNHAYNSYNNLPLGVYGWGRGLGWYIIALIDTYLEMDEDNYKEILKENIKNAADSYINYQREDGGFGSIIQNQRTYDSSVTSILAYFYSRCYDIFGENKYLDVSNNCINKLKSVTRITGKIDLCQGDTKDIGVHSQTFDIMPFAQGFALRAALINLGRK